MELLSYSSIGPNTSQNNPVNGFHFPLGSMPSRSGLSLNSASSSPRVSSCSTAPLGSAKLLTGLGDDEYSPSDPVLGDEILVRVLWGHLLNIRPGTVPPSTPSSLLLQGSLQVTQMENRKGHPRASNSCLVTVASDISTVLNYRS